MGSTITARGDRCRRVLARPDELVPPATMNRYALASPSIPAMCAASLRVRSMQLENGVCGR